MGAKREGTVVERATKSGITYALRFIAYGERMYLTLGSDRDGLTREAAETELDNIIADVRRGIWKAPERDASTEADRQTAEQDGDGQTQAAELTFYEFSKQRLDKRKLEVSQRMWEYEEWALRIHLWPYFGPWLLSEFTAEAVDDYRVFKLEESARRRAAIDRRKPLRDEHRRVLRPLAASSINKTIDVLGSYLSVAVDYYGNAAKNGAKGKRRRLKVAAKRPVHLDAVGQIMGLLDAAADMDATAYWRNGDRAALIATLLLAGPRAEELGELLWRDVDLINRRLYVGRSKTAAGLREIPMLPLLHRILVVHKARSRNTGPDDYVFATDKGTQRDKDNIRNRVLAPVLAPADELLLGRGEVPLPKGLTPHKLRHTFASILVACGEDPTSVMAQLGHTDPRFTLKVYSHMMRRSPEERARLKAYVNDIVEGQAQGLSETPLLEAAHTRELAGA
jgi:integrase